jgi:hypothetical protein
MEIINLVDKICDMDYFWESPRKNTKPKSGLTPNVPKKIISS